MGLAMASRLELNGMDYTIIEQGDTVGWNMQNWGHIRLFTSWQESIDPVSLELLKRRGIDISIPSDCPSGNAYVERFLSKLATIIPQENLLLKSKVSKVLYQPTSKTFDINYEKNGKIYHLSGDIVIDASGTWGNFNRLVKHQNKYANHIYSGIPDATFIADMPKNAKIAVVGSGHSAMNSIIELTTRPDAQLIWLIRDKQAKFGLSKVGGKSNQLENKVADLINNKRLELKTDFEIQSIILRDDRLDIHSHNHKALKAINCIISNIGCYPDYSYLNGFQPELDNQFLSPSNLAPKINPRLHSCDTVTYEFKDTLVADIPYFVIGMKSFGKASNFLLSKGYVVLDELMQDLKYIDDFRYA